MLYLSCVRLEAVMKWTWGVAKCVGLWTVSVKNAFSWMEASLISFDTVWSDQCLISCFGRSQLLLFCLQPSRPSLGASPLALSLPLSLYQQFGSCCFLVLTPTSTSEEFEEMKARWEMEGRGRSHLWRPLWSRTAARFNLLCYWFPKLNNDIAMVFSSSPSLLGQE